MRYLVVDWLKFIPALLLLLTPMGLFHGRRIKYRSLARDWDQHWQQVVLNGQHAIDLLRAALGTWWLLDSLSPVPNAQGVAKFAPFITQAAIRIIAMFLQTIVCREPESINAPFGFAAGILLAGMSPLPATIALALTIPIAMGARAPAAFFPLLGVAFVGTAVLYEGRGMLMTTIPGALAVMVPWIWALLFRRDLVITYRTRRSESGNTHSPLR